MYSRGLHFLRARQGHQFFWGSFKIKILKKVYSWTCSGLIYPLRALIKIILLLINCGWLELLSIAHLKGRKKLNDSRRRKSILLPQHQLITSTKIITKSLEFECFFFLIYKNIRGTGSVTKSKANLRKGLLLLALLFWLWMESSGYNVY